MLKTSDASLGAMIIGYCYNREHSVEEIAKHIYKSKNEKGFVRVYRCIEILLHEGVLVPMFKNRVLRFKVNNGSVKEFGTINLKE